MVVGFTTTCAISAYHHWNCEFEPRSGEMYLIQHYVIKFCQWLAIGQWFSPVSSTNKTDCHDKTEILLKMVLKHHKTNQITKREIENVIQLCNPSKCYLIELTTWTGLIVPLLLKEYYNSMTLNEYNWNMLGFSTTCAISASITTNIVSSNPVHGEVYSIQHYALKFVSDYRQVDGFLQVLRFLPPIKLTATI
jgi:hypothetical protein